MITLINPNLIVQRNDLFTTGIVYMPIPLAYLAAVLQKAGHNIALIDAFAEAPNRIRSNGTFIIRGLATEDTVMRVPEDTRIAVVYAGHLIGHEATVAVLEGLRQRFPEIPLVVMENPHSVTGYSLRRVLTEFFDHGATHVLTGEAEERGLRLLEALLLDPDGEGTAGIDGIAYRNGQDTIYSPPICPVEDLDSLPFPAWDLLPLEQYWRLGYGHGPVETGRYLPLLTSRGCPYACNFCIIPETNQRSWRGRTPGSVVDEIECFMLRYGVTEFHVEDVNPTVNDARTQGICTELIGRGLKIKWKLCAGTKVETIRSRATVDLLARSGCNYVSMSPETGSPAVLRAMNKPFDLEHARQVVRWMSDRGVRTQCCFVLGFPGETDQDRRLTQQLAFDLTRGGVDEIALFIVTPAPGSSLFDSFGGGYRNFSELTFSPTWRTDYRALASFRLLLYGRFVFWKTVFHPLAVIRQLANFLTRRFETKMEMAPYRALHTLVVSLFRSQGG